MGSERKITGRWPIGLVGYLAVLTVVFWRTLASWASVAWSSDVLSYVLLIPFVSVYLAHLNRAKCPEPRVAAPGIGGLLLAIGLGALFATWTGASPQSWDSSDILAIQVASFVTCLIAGGYFFFGRAWMRVQAFPAAFLCAMIPLPAQWVATLEVGSQYASAEAAALLLGISGVPFLRDGNVFQIPGIVLRVAQECSGIRSSLVLLITSILVANLFLHSTWRRLVLVAVVIPLAILRNGFRITVIAMLCVNLGPHMVDHAIHHRGGPVFFALSLIPLFLILLWLRRGDRPSKGKITSPPVAAGPSAGLSDCPALPK